MMQEMQSPPLKGINVLDLSRVLAGPLWTMILAQLGARVIKVEIPGAGFANDKSLYFSSLNYKKQSIALNLKNAPDRAIFERLSVG
jgi:CoA:oxalate CoA-transferase